MSYFAVEKRVVDEVKPHPYADNLEIVTIEGLVLQFVTVKKMLAKSMEVFYFPVDAVMSESLLEQLGLTGCLKGKQKNIVATIKLKGIISEGILVECAKFVYAPQGLNDYSAYFDVHKHEPVVQFCNGSSLLPLPKGVSKYDIEGCNRNMDAFNEFTPETQLWISEKVEGTNIAITVNNKGESFVSQRNHTIVHNEDNSYWKTATQLGLIHIARDILASEGCEQVTLRGELFGKGVQGDYYTVGHHKISIYDVLITDANRTYYWDSEQLLDNRLLKPFLVPTVFTGTYGQFNEMIATCGDIDTFSTSVSQINPSLYREGIVIKPMKEKNSTLLGRWILKHRSKTYLSKQHNPT